MYTLSGVNHRSTSAGREFIMPNRTHEEEEEEDLTLTRCQALL